MSYPRGLTPEEQAAWSRLASSVTPFEGRKLPKVTSSEPKTVTAKPVKVTPSRPAVSHQARPAAPQPIRRRPVHNELDSHWDRKLKAGQIAPDYTLDLHGHTLDGAYTRILSGLDQARAMDARVVLVIAGRARPVDPADRAEKRGAIRAKLLDWIAASHHANSIAAVRKAHQRHGGAGALYLVLRRQR